MIKQYTRSLIKKTETRGKNLHNMEKSKQSYRKMSLKNSDFGSAILTAIISWILTSGMRENQSQSRNPNSIPWTTNKPNTIFWGSKK